MDANASFGNYGPGPQNTVDGYGPQSNLNGVGTQNNYYGFFQDPQVVEAQRLCREKEDCLRSLSFPNMNTRRQNIDDALPGTCDWILSTAEFEEWRDRDDLSSHNGVLWIKGKPGAGKSTLMSHTLSHCEDIFGDHLIIAFFFNARGGVLEKTPIGMMRSTVYQLLKKDDTIHGTFLDLYREKRLTCGDGELQWGQSELKRFVQTIIKQPHPELKPLLLCIDALDECDEKEVRGVVDFIQTLSVNAVNSGVNLRVCLSSRHYPWISMKKNLELIVETRREHGKDIVVYVEEKLCTEKNDIRKQIQEKANGVFMWVVLVVAMLNKAHDEGRDEAMQTTLDEVPGDLEGLFHTLLGKNDSDRAELISMLQWVLFSQRPLTPEELYVVVVGESLPSHEAIRRRIITSSKGLMEIRTKETDTKENRQPIISSSRFVQFIHLAVNDFLYRNKRLEALDPTLGPDAISASHARLWRYCWPYIRHAVKSPKKQCMTKLFRNHRFLSYARIHIFDHIDKALSNNMIRRRLGHDIMYWLTAHNQWLEWILSDRDFGQHIKLRFTCQLDGSIDVGLVYTLAFAPYWNLINFVLARGVDVNVQGGEYGNALQVASIRGSYSTVKLLLEKGADVNAQGGKYGNALQAASKQGNYNIVKLLLEKGADVNAQGGKYGNALQAASKQGNYNIVKLLLKRGADVNAQGGKYGNALLAASIRVDFNTFRLLRAWSPSPIL